MYLGKAEGIVQYIGSDLYRNGRMRTCEHSLLVVLYFLHLYAPEASFGEHGAEISNKSSFLLSFCLSSKLMLRNKVGYIKTGLCSSLAFLCYYIIVLVNTLLFFRGLY